MIWEELAISTIWLRALISVRREPPLWYPDLVHGLGHVRVRAEERVVLVAQVPLVHRLVDLYTDPVLLDEPISIPKMLDGAEETGHGPV